MAIKILVLILILTLLGCSSTPKEHVSMVTVPCKTQAVDKPISVFDSLPDSASLFDQIKALLADRENMKAYEIKLEAANKACQ